MATSALPTGHNGRVKVDRYLRALDHPEIYVAGDLASVTDPDSGHLAHLLKDAIEWEYRQSVKHLRGWEPIAR